MERWVKANRVMEDSEDTPKPVKTVYVDMAMVDEIIPHKHSNGEWGTKLRSNVMDACFTQSPGHFLPNNHDDYVPEVVS